MNFKSFSLLAIALAASLLVVRAEEKPDEAMENLDNFDELNDFDAAEFADANEAGDEFEAGENAGGDEESIGAQ